MSRPESRKWAASRDSERPCVPPLPLPVQQTLWAVLAVPVVLGTVPAALRSWPWRDFFSGCLSVPRNPARSRGQRLPGWPQGGNGILPKYLLCPRGLTRVSSLRSRSNPGKSFVTVLQRGECQGSGRRHTRQHIATKGEKEDLNPDP